MGRVHGRPRAPLYGSFKGDIDIDVEVEVDVDPLEV